MNESTQTELDDREALAWASTPKSEESRDSAFSIEMSEAIEDTLRMLEAA